MITRKELKRLRKRLESCPKVPQPKKNCKYARAKHDNANFRVEYSNRTYVSGYNTAKG